MTPKFNNLLKFILVLAIGFTLAFLSTKVHGQERTTFRHSLLGTWELNQEEKYGIIVRWAFYPDVDWLERKMGDILMYINGEYSAILEWRTQNGAIEVRPGHDTVVYGKDQNTTIDTRRPGRKWRWIHFTTYKTTKWKLYLEDISFGRLEFYRVCDTDHAREYCN